MRAAIVNRAGVVTNIVEVAPREMPPGSRLIPDDLPVTIGWTYTDGQFAPPQVVPDPPLPPARNLEAEYAARIDTVSTIAGLRQVMRDYFKDRASTN